MVCEMAIKTFSLVVADGSHRDSGIPWKIIFPSSNLSSSKFTLLFRHLFSCSTFSILSCSAEFFVLISWHSLKLVSQIFLNSNSISKLAFRGSIRAFVSCFISSRKDSSSGDNFLLAWFSLGVTVGDTLIFDFLLVDETESFSVNLHLCFVDGDGEKDDVSFACFNRSCLYWGHDRVVLLSMYSC